MQISRRGMSNKNSSEFKSFFRLRLQDRPIKLATKLKESYKTSKTVRKTISVVKYVFGKASTVIEGLAFSFVFFALPGTIIPGQLQSKLLLIELRRQLTMAYAALRKPSGSGTDHVKVI